MKKIYDGRPDIDDRVKNDDVVLAINMTEGTQPVSDCGDIRRVALTVQIPYLARVAAAIAVMKARGYRIRTLQGWGDG